MPGQVHIKGRLLQMLEEGGPQWDYELSARIAREYEEVHGDYWAGTVRLNLADLYSGGLIYEEDESVEPANGRNQEKALFQFALSPFGRQRMIETGLLRDRAGEHR